MHKYTSGRVKKTSQSGITSDRYQFLGLDQAEPDLGDPLIGPSSMGANPVPLSGSQYVLIANSNNTGKRYWIPTTNLSTGLIPGSFTVYNNDVIVGLANSFNKFNFVGTGVTVDPVGFTPGDQTGIATIRISVADVNIPGNINSIAYKSNTGNLQGASNFVYVSGNVGIGSTIPTESLDVLGNIRLSGNVITSGVFSGNLSGTATTATNLADAANITTGTISSSRLSGTYPISITGTATTALSLADNVVITSSLFNKITVSGISTFTNGPVLIGTSTATGTTSQPLQVSGGAYVSGNLGIGTTTPVTPLQVELYGVKTGFGTFNATPGISTNIDSFVISTNNFKTAEYTLHVGYGTYIQAQKVLVMQNTNSAYSQEYAVMFDQSLIVSIGATVSGGSCVLQATPQTGISGIVTYTFKRETIL